MATKTFFGKTPDGFEVFLFSVQNKNGLRFSAINYGAIIQSLEIPDRHGKVGNIVLGYNSLEDYLQDKFYLGAIAGRYANRIAKGIFSIDGQAYHLQTNDGSNHLHGGVRGFDKVVWRGDIISDQVIRFTYSGNHGEEGYPGNLEAEVMYELTDKNELIINSKATSDAPTIINLVQHSYFNLSGAQSVLDHQLIVHADTFLPVRKDMIPTGEFRPVVNTAFDFKNFRRIGSQIDHQEEQVYLAKGFDHCWVLNSQETLKPAASLFDPGSGRMLNVLTTKPGIHVYTGNYLDRRFHVHEGICLETEYFPDSPNQPVFPSAILRPGGEYRHTTVFNFSTRI
jgi:aldose 1-epimerase